MKYFDSFFVWDQKKNDKKWYSLFYFERFLVSFKNVDTSTLVLIMCNNIRIFREEKDLNKIQWSSIGGKSNFVRFVEMLSVRLKKRIKEKELVSSLQSNLSRRKRKICFLSFIPAFQTASAAIFFSSKLKDIYNIMFYCEGNVEKKM